jgi:hypothetical protein
MRVSGRRIDLELNGPSRCQCQIYGSLPILWHWENCESSSARLRSKSEHASGYKLAMFAGDA